VAPERLPAATAARTLPRMPTSDTRGGGDVLFAYDGSEYARAAIQEAARQLGAGRRAIVLVVWQPFGALPFSTPALPPDLEAELLDEAAKTAGEGTRLARSAGFDAWSLVQTGEPVWRTIVDAADAHDAGLVVLGSHGRTGIRLVLMGSVASAVTRHTQRPVLIVHAPTAEH
jgi:nucleotide-binding universal stress UspA family protein